MTNKESKLVRGFTYLESPLKKGNLITQLPGKGPSTYQKVGQEILAEGLDLQTGYETSSFLKSAYELNEPETKDVQSKMKNGWVWVYQTNFWLPKKQKNSGMYSVHDKKALGRNMEFNQEQLEEALKGAEVYQGVRFNPETGVAFAPRSTIQLGKETDWDKFAINGLNIALFSPEGAENMSKLGKDNFGYGYTWGVTENNDIESRVSSVGGYWGFDRGLDVNGGNWGGNDVGRSWGKAAKQLK